MTEAEQLVYVIDNDTSMRSAIKSLVLAVGLNVETFSSGQEFLDSKLPEVPGCVVLDVRLPGRSGLDLQRKLAERGIQIPIIFVTGHGDIPMSVKARKGGAVYNLPGKTAQKEVTNAPWRRNLDRGRR
jgi:FixJ family two-component response regulator